MTASRRLTKAHAERLVAAVDTNDLCSAIEASLRFLLDPEPGTDADALYSIAACQGRWTEEYLVLLRERNTEALHGLAIDLAELRMVPTQRRFDGEPH